MSPSSTVVVEVAHSEHQNWRVSRLLAEEYILGSNLEVRVVVGVNLEYEKTKRAVFSVWRAKQREDEVWVVETVVRNRTFRNDDDKSTTDNQTLGLRLRLEDFADEKTCQRFKAKDKSFKDRDIFVSCDGMYGYLERAEAMDETAAKAQ
ncbi:hypothetical protein H2204_008400 [Knufia peltigerae]|uniref:Uncharacterized protein n=1 Tax=Knufia peltigerae TaxID=1002370 RepID=A0AA39CUM4_9EURO|nr:hypothetical protein H2204_008400 [Knufia peltigerae]